MNLYLINKFNEIEKLHWWWEGRRELIKILIKPSKPKRILDVGCGTGETLSFLKTKYPNAKLYGVDMMPEAVAYSKKRGHKNITNGQANKLPFKNSFFDAVFILDVLEHIKDDYGTITEIKRVLKKDGIITITAPALNFIWSNHDTGQGHQRRYDKNRLIDVSKKAGLKIEFLSYFNFIFSFPIIVLRLVSRLKIFSRIADYDRGINYDIADVGLLNSVLKYIFINEIKLIKRIKYPIGISLVAKLKNRK